MCLKILYVSNFSRQKVHEEEIKNPVTVESSHPETLCLRSSGHSFFFLQVIVIDPVVMSMHGPASGESQAAGGGGAASCADHDYETIQPIVVASAKFGFQGVTAKKSAIIAETQALYETISIPSTRAKLVYSSPRSRGYLSTIQLQLTPEAVPRTLAKIYLRITIEGVLFEKTFEADSNLKYTYSWKGINVYRQRVYGTTSALVKVGYEYETCSQIIWNVQSTRISGKLTSVCTAGFPKLLKWPIYSQVITSFFTTFKPSC